MDSDLSNENNPLNSIYVPPGTIYKGGNLLHNLLLFGRVCRVLGMDVTPNRMLEVAQALEYIDLGHKADVYHTMRALMVTRQRDLERFDEAFDLFWRRPTEGWTELNLQSLGEERLKRKTQFLPPANSEPADDPQSTTEADPSLIAIVPTYSQQEILRHKDFAEMSAEELAMAQRIMTDLPQSLGLRRTRRFQSGKGRSLDLRQSFRRNMRFAGEIFELPTRTVRWKPRPIILLCDISGSMERYTRVLLHFMHTLASSPFQVESFVFSTQLTRITHPIRQKSVDDALRDIGTTVKEWGGGTKTGESLRYFNFHWSRRVLGRGAIVMIITDGWDRGEPRILRKEIQRLQRSCYRLIWLNPLLGAPEYEPLTRGAQTMLPYVDDFLPVRNLANLESIVKELQTLHWRRTAKPAHEKYIV